MANHGQIAAIAVAVSHLQRAMADAGMAPVAIAVRRNDLLELRRGRLDYMVYDCDFSCVHPDTIAGAPVISLEGDAKGGFRI